MAFVLIVCRDNSTLDSIKQIMGTMHVLYYDLINTFLLLHVLFNTI